MGFILTDESLLSRDLLIHLHASARSVAVRTGNDPSRACNFHPEMARVVSSNWTTIIRTIATRIIATVMRRITAPEVISLIVNAVYPVYGSEDDDNALNFTQPNFLFIRTYENK